MISKFPLSDTIDGTGHHFFGCKSSLYAGHSLHLVYSTNSVGLSRPFSGNQSSHSLQRKTVVCYKDLNFCLGRVPEAAQYSFPLARNRERYAWWIRDLKRNHVKTNAFWEDVKISFEKALSSKGAENEKTGNGIDLVLPSVSEQMVDPSTQGGNLSAAAVSSIEQFGRLVGLTGEQLKSKFYSDATTAAQKEARNLVEYCCFYYLSKCGNEFHPSIKDDEFRGLMFLTMLAWQQPYEDSAQNDDTLSPDSNKSSESIRTCVVGEDAFIRLAPAIPGVADRPTAHHLFKVLTDGDDGLSLKTWNTYLSELQRIHEERVQNKNKAGKTLSLAADESVLLSGGTKSAPVQMWNKSHMSWPGRLTLTDQALYFEANALLHHQKSLKLSLVSGAGNARKTKVGPFGAPVLDSAIEIKSGDKSEAWLLEFADFSGEGWREVWFALINEICSVYSFIHEYGPAADDPLVSRVSGTEHGSKKAITSALQGISRVQAVRSTIGRGLEHPGRLLQFSYSASAPLGELVLQSLAVHFWSGFVQGDSKDIRKVDGTNDGFHSDDTIWMDPHVEDLDGSVFFRRWMKSPTWESPRSSSFWKKKTRGKLLWLGKDLLVGELTYIDKAVKICKEQTQMDEETKLTIDAASLKGIPINIDLFKELLLPLSVVCDRVMKLRKWESPAQTALFLSGAIVIIYKNWLKFTIPAILLTTAVIVMTLRISRWRRLGSVFERVSIKEQPPSSTLQKILALKEALEDTELQIQQTNLILLKLRTVAFSGLPQVTTKVILALLGSALIFVIVPFRYLCIFFILDQFTYELDFRRPMVIKFENRLKEWWQAIPAAPITILPHEKSNSKNFSETKMELQQTTGAMIAEAVKDWFAEGK